MASRGDIEQIFPRLRSSRYDVTSPRTIEYNCVAWAAGDTQRRWDPDPDYYWPEGIPRESTLVAVQAVFLNLGFEACESPDLESGFDKVAIFSMPPRIPTHVARQLPNGNWTSKLGDLEDIEHELNGVEGEEYGSISLILKRPKSK